MNQPPNRRILLIDDTPSIHDDFRKILMPDVESNPALDDMESARALYEDLGFVEIPPYYHNPIAGAHYLKADIF